MDKQKRQDEIVSMFDDIAKTYDLANRVLSFGIDIQWRKRGCNRAYDTLNKKSIDRVVDVATGTGDMLIHWRDRAKAKGIDVKEFIGIDPSKGMLELAKKKVEFASFLEGKAQNLPLEDSSAEVISISYGIRNVVDRKEALEEFYRVLKPNGILVILEFTKQDKRGLLSPFVDFYMKKVLPTVGGLVSKNYEAYRYLPDSIEEFLTSKMLSEELKSSGFDMRYIKPFSMGISTLFVAQKR